MRQFKFRAWDKKENRMRLWEPVEDEGLQDFGSLWNLLDKSLWAYTVMQFTGLKDKNQTEIYEGDIVKINYNTPYFLGGYMEVNCITIITWIEHDARFMLVDKNNEQMHSFEFGTSMMEVVGNVFENKYEDFIKEKYHEQKNSCNEC